MVDFEIEDTALSERRIGIGRLLTGNRFAAIPEWAAETVEREAERGRLALWVPVLIGLGVVAYFALPAEPGLPQVAGVAFIATAFAFASRRWIWLFRFATAIALILAGLALMTARTATVATPIITAERTGELTGWVESVEQTSANVRRLVVIVDRIEDLTPEATPRKVRITVRARFDEVEIGSGISGLVALFPPSGPVMPGGHDFGRDLFFEGIGGSGFSYGAPDIVELGAAPLGVRLAKPISNLRSRIGARIEAAIPGEAGAIIMALVTGDRGGISDETSEALRRSGLGHILAISGLHMALVVGSVFGGLRALLALSPAIALRRPIKKWAAIGALLAAAGYLLLSGGSVATQRAFIMATVVLVAILLDRRAFSLRNVAVAATIILLMTPEAIITVSFQMSFAATLALIAGFEYFAERRRLRLVVGPPATRSVTRAVWFWANGLTLTSLLAGLATAPFAAFHFNRTAPLSLVANVVAMPFFAFLVMPMALFGVLLMPFGLEHLPLSVAGWAIGIVLDVAELVSDWSGAAGLVPSGPAVALLLVALGIVWLCLWSERWRLAGILPIVAGILVIAFAAPPTALIAEDGSAVAVRGFDGRYAVIGEGAEFETETWLRADADPRPLNDPSLAAGIFCDVAGCTAPIGATGLRLAVTHEAAALAEDCRLAAIVVTELGAPTSCAALPIDSVALARGGAHAIYLETGEGEAPVFRFVTARPEQRRPWMPPVLD